jgi:hypothetical protein
VANPYDPKKIVAQILAKQHDDALDDIFQAILERVRAGEDRMRWKIGPWVAHDLTVTEDDLLVEECLRIEEATKVPWHRIDPIDAVNEAAAVLTVALSGRRGLSLEEATKQVGALGARALRDMISKYIAEGSPLDQVATGADDRPLP